MPLPLRLGRPLVPVTCAAATTLLLLGSLLQAPQAAAAPIDGGEANAFPTIIAVADAGESCTTTTTRTSQSSPFAGTKRVALAADESGTVVDDADATQRATVRASARGVHTSIVRGSQVSSVLLTGTIEASLQTTFVAASACHVTVTPALYSSSDITVTRAGWATLRVQLTESEGNAYASLSRAGTNLDAYASLTEVRGASTVRVHLSPGTYGLNLGMRAERRSATATRDSNLGTTATSMRAGYSFTVAGAALGATRGTGTVAATLDPAVACGTNRVGVRWKKLAGRAELATIRVNGRVVRTVRDPRPGRRVVVGVPGTRPNSVSVSLRGRTATRSYEACR